VDRNKRSCRITEQFRIEQKVEVMIDVNGKHKIEYEYSANCCTNKFTF